MVRLNRIYTRTGDDGTTGLGDGSRLPKHDLRIAAYGTVDELSSELGVVLASGPGELEALLREVQNDLFDVGADLCVPGAAGERLRIGARYVLALEQAIDRHNERLSPLASFVLPGGTALAARLHVARTVCRRAERLVSELAAREAAGQVNPEVLRYLNRLSDLLFVLARVANDEGRADVLWRPGARQAAGETPEGGGAKGAGSSKPALALRWHTPAAWAPAALADVRALLSDHAHCELGAAAAAQGFVARAVADEALIERMAALAVEELRHFRRVHRLLCELGGALEPVRKNPYVEGLTRAARAGAGGLALCDRLLVAALVEERSRERFERLAEHAALHADPRVGELYAELGPSEAGHAALFVELARARAGARLVAERLDALARAEAALVAALPFAPRIHSGPPVQPGARTVERSSGRARPAALQP